MSEHAAITRFRDAHAARGGAGEIVILPESVHTAALAAAALGCEVGAIANSLLFDAGGTPVLILTSGAHRVDTALTAGRVGVERLKRATPEFVREHTGQVIGGAPTPVPFSTVWSTASRTTACQAVATGPRMPVTAHTPRRPPTIAPVPQYMRWFQTGGCSPSPTGRPSRVSSARAGT